MPGGSGNGGGGVGGEHLSEINLLDPRAPALCPPC